MFSPGTLEEGMIIPHIVSFCSELSNGINILNMS